LSRAAAKAALFLACFYWLTRKRIYQFFDTHLLIAGDKIAFKVTRDATWDFDNTYISIFNDRQSVAEIGERIQEYFGHARTPEHDDLFENPDGWLSDVRIRQDRPCYQSTRLPHFGIAPLDDLANTFALTGDDLALLQREFLPLTLDPTYFNEDVPVRHIFCETDIENALLKKRHQAHEMSSMLGRKVWMSTQQLTQQLMRMRALLKTHENYEVCFLNDKHFSQLMFQSSLWGNEAVICWTAGRPAISLKDYLSVTGMQSVCAATWDDIPADKRSAAAAVRKINRWIKK